MCEEFNKKLIEYEKCIDAWKHMGTLQLALMPIYVALMGAASLIIFRENALPEPTLKIFFIGLICITIIFYTIQESHMTALRKFLERLSIIEDELGFKIINQLPKKKKYKIEPARWSIRFLYLVFLIFWFYNLLDLY